MRPDIHIVTDDDRRWLEDGQRREWTLPPAAPWYLRAWLVRHVRAFVVAWRIDTWDRAWREVGLIPTGYDQWVVYAIWRGWI